jgi:hypothetical protein
MELEGLLQMDLRELKKQRRQTCNYLAHVDLQISLKQVPRPYP